MKRILPLLAAVAVFAACSDSTDSADLGSLSASFQSVPLGFENAQHSFAATGDQPNPEWGPRGMRGPGGHDKGPGFGGVMGGLGGLFFGEGFDAGFGKGGRGEPSMIGVCTFNAGTGRITCDPVTRGGLTITRSAAYQDASGAAQNAFNETTTNTINTRVTVTGTKIRRHDGDTSTVNANSDRTVAGLLGANRTVNGTSAATENISGTDSTGHYTAQRVAGDTTSGVVIPNTSSSSVKPHPTAGTLTRAMRVTFTRDGAAAVVRTRREVVTYDGSDTAKIVITQDGETKNCTMTLPRGRLTCS